jgi:CBS domain-containing protein
MTAKAREESIIYAIPIAVFRPFVANNAAVLNFIRNFATNKPSKRQ